MVFLNICFFLLTFFSLSLSLSAYLHTSVFLSSLFHNSVSAITPLFSLPDTPSLNHLPPFFSHFSLFSLFVPFLYSIPRLFLIFPPLFSPPISFPLLCTSSLSPFPFAPANHRLPLPGPISSRHWQLAYPCLTLTPIVRLTCFSSWPSEGVTETRRRSSTRPPASCILGFFSLLAALWWERRKR